MITKTQLLIKHKLQIEVSTAVLVHVKLVEIYSKAGTDLTNFCMFAPSTGTTLVWLGLVTGLVILVDISLNFSNLLNP